MMTYPHGTLSAPGSPKGHEEPLRHFGGGRKGIFVLLRYLFIIAASYLLIFGASPDGIHALPALVVALALASNVALSIMRPATVFSWYVEAPILIADTLWVSWALHSTGTMGQEFFLLYFFVLFLAALGENFALVLLGATLVSAANVYLIDAPAWTAPHLLRVVFFFAVALFYGGVVAEIRRERNRATQGLAWAKELEDTVEQRTDELRRLYDEAQAANRLKSEFIATMSHELRTPLHIVMGYTDLLLDGEFGPITPEAANILRIMARQQVELRDLINSTLNMGRLESGKIELQLSRVDLRELFRLLEEEAKALWTNPKVRMIWNIAGDLPALHSDRTRLKTVLKNLIDNAAKFTEQGSITISARRDGNGLEVLVSDTGIGIPTDKQALIFEPFRQVDSSTTRRYRGVGLGLYIAARLTEALGGRLSVESELHRGSTFRVWIPFSPPAGPEDT